LNPGKSNNRRFSERRLFFKENPTMKTNLNLITEAGGEKRLCCDSQPLQYHLYTDRQLAGTAAGHIIAARHWRDVIIA
jgi:hypothetical protein